MGKSRTEKTLYALALLANLASFATVLNLGLERSLYGGEFLLWLLLLAAPVLAVLALWFPNREESRLRKRVELAELRRRLKELGEP